MDYSIFADRGTIAGRLTDGSRGRRAAIGGKKEREEKEKQEANLLRRERARRPCRIGAIHTDCGRLNCQLRGSINNATRRPLDWLTHATYRPEESRVEPRFTAAAMKTVFRPAVNAAEQIGSAFNESFIRTTTPRRAIKSSLNLPRICPGLPAVVKLPFYSSTRSAALNRPRRFPN